MQPFDLQTAINNAPDFSEIDIPANALIALTASLQIYNRQGLYIRAAGGVGSSSTRNGQSGALITWNGPATSPVIDCQSSRGITIEGLTIQCLTDADSGVNFDLLPTGSKQICSDNTINRCAIIGHTNASSLFACVRISRNSKTNCDFIRVRNSYLNAQAPYPPTPAGYGIWVGPSSNVKSLIFENTQVSGAASGVYLSNGDFRATNLSGTGNAIDFNISECGDPCVIECANFEQSGTPIQISGANSAIIVRSSRWGNFTGPYFINIAGPSIRALFLDGNGMWPANEGKGLQHVISIPSVPPIGFPIFSRGNAYWCPITSQSNYTGLVSQGDLFATK